MTAALPTPVAAPAQRAPIPDTPPAPWAPDPTELHGHALLARHGSEVLCEIDAKGHIVWISPSVERLTGKGPASMQDQPLTALFHVNDHARLAGLLEPAHAGPQRDSLRLLRAGNPPMWVECLVERAAVADASGRYANGATSGPLVCVLRDITEHRQIEDGLARLARTDTLTGLPNRLRLTERIDASILRATRAGGEPRDHGFALAMFDLDHFKYVNDSLGHDAGDELLCAVGARLADLLRDTDVLARWGGDEFVLLLARETNAAVAQHRIEACIAALGAPFLVRGRVMHIGASAGIAMYPGDGSTQTELMRNADLAMYRAKAHGPGTVLRFTADLAERARQHLLIENALHDALSATATGPSPFALRYQPIMAATDQGVRMTGVEALVRWFQDDPEAPGGKRMIGPDLFIPIAEESGLIVPLGAWVLDEACRHARSLIDAGQVDEHFYISVNVSARQFQAGDFTGLLRTTLAAHDLAPRHVQLEVTESAIMQNPERAAETMQAIRALGVQIAIDDFGTGFSSLAYLARFPASGLKIDKSFVRAMDNRAGMAIVEATVAIASALDMKITAEGVETAAQRDALLACGCQRLQGYLFDKPLTPEELAQRLAVISCSKR